MVIGQKQKFRPTSRGNEVKMHPQQIKLIGRRAETLAWVDETPATEWLGQRGCHHEIRPVSELVDRPLVVEGVGEDPITYAGYTVLPVRLDHGDKVEGEEGILVPFLVANKTMKCPIIGTNFMQEKWPVGQQNIQLHSPK